YKKIKMAGIKPVIGLSVNVEFSEGVNLPIVLYAKTNEGYQNLLKISSATSLRDSQDLPLKWLQGYAEGLICVAYISQLKPEWLLHMQELQMCKDLFGTAFYIGYTRQFGTYHDASVLQVANDVVVPIAAYYESSFLQK
ncbi:PHP domain-containing protein, partial [Pseudomonas aeruginosa]